MCKAHQNVLYPLHIRFCLKPENIPNFGLSIAFIHYNMVVSILSHVRY